MVFSKNYFSRRMPILSQEMDSNNVPLSLTLTYLNRSGNMQEFLPSILEFFTTKELIFNTEQLNDILRIYFNEREQQVPNTEIESLGSVGWNRITLFLQKSFSDIKKILNTKLSDFESGIKRDSANKQGAGDFVLFTNAAWNSPERLLYRETEKYLEKIDWALSLTFRFTERIISVGCYNKMVSQKELMPIVVELGGLADELSRLNFEIFSNTKHSLAFS